jgi:signal peptidase II
MQAARGTSVVQPAASRRLRVIFALVALAAYAADQVSKVVATRTLEGRPDVQVVGDLLQLHLTFNPGAAFSTGTGFTPVITVIAILATLGVLYYARRLGSRLWAVSLGILLAGITGNLTDRLLREPGPFRGHVVDFLMLPNWPVFNIADVCINVAAALIIVQAFRGVRIDGTREGQPDDDPADEPDATDDEPTPAEKRAE